jgi:hypothetical protein
MSGLFAGDTAGIAATWTAAIVTVIVLGGMLGERRAFALAQHLLAGLATGYLALLAIREVIVPRVIEPLVTEPAGRPELWLALLLVIGTAAVAWLPRPLAAVPLGVMIGSVAAFALGGAVIGTALPQAAAAIVVPGQPADVISGLLALAITCLVLLSLVRRMPTGGVVDGAWVAGRWLVIGGVGALLGFLLVSRLTLLLDRLHFVVVDALGLGR